jgi:hypothetical protein
VVGVGGRGRIAGVTIADLMPLPSTGRDDDEPATKPQFVRPEQKKG